MKDPAPDTVIVPCHGCGKDIILPAGRIRAMARAGRLVVQFCSRRCNLVFVAKEGARQQEELLKDA